MTNTSLLKERLKASGLKLEFIAKKIGITRQSLSDKVNGKTQFNQYQINELCELLGITDLKEKDAIFFAK